MIPTESRPALAPGVRLQMDATNHEPVLLYPEGILQLNETAHAIVLRCDGRTTVVALAEALAAEYTADPADLLDDICGCLRDLRERRLIVFPP